MSQLNKILLQRLKRKGISSGAIPGFIRNLSNTLSGSPDLNLGDLNNRLHWLGWDDVDLDYHTFQLIIAELESHCLTVRNRNPCDITALGKDVK